MSTEGTDATHHPYNDVFISSWHEESELSFPNQLYLALEKKHIKTFIGEVGLEEVGDNNSEKIKKSRISIVVLSKIYIESNSQGQLDQLVKILECKKKMNQIVYPIYYLIDPSELEAMATHDGIRGVETWKSALAEVVQIKPQFVLKKRFERQDKLIQRIVEFVYQSLFPDVFISFHDENKFSFPHQLHDALHNKRIRTTFSSNVREEKVDNNSSLASDFEKIEQSWISIVILSEKYASHTQCLDQLVKILECKKKMNQIIYPIYYLIDPSELEAMATHDGIRGVETWKSALAEVVQIKPQFMFKKRFERQDKLIQRIVEFVYQSLFPDVFISFYDEKSKFSFPNQLHDALHNKRIRTTFSSNVREEKVDNNSTLASDFEKIEQSWISIVILSEKYASHTQCLDQLVKILECKKKMNQIVYPIYYLIDDPSKLEAIATGLAKTDVEISRWMSALAEVVQIKPKFVFKNWFGRQDKLIQRIVELVYRSLFRYDVFISFKGQDTGYTFTGNLFNALRLKKINTFFVNDEVWKKEDVEISSSFLKAMKESRISIVVLSQSYAKSTWCLNELNNIIKGKDYDNQQLVWPIFYKVEPSLVRRQEKHYKDAMDQHMEKNCHKVPKWKKNLTKVANLTGVSSLAGYEYEHIEKIVESTVQSLSKYDVFLSFSREDTGHSFARYLYNVLCQSGFKTFMDDVGIGNGDQISDTVAKAIENSKHYIIIFSKNYAYSDWCLNEIVEILDWSVKKNHLIWPILYNVKLDHVRYPDKKNGDRDENSYACAISAHEEKYGKNPPGPRVGKWKSTLTKVTNSGGYAKPSKSKDDFVAARNDTELVKMILEHLSVPNGQLWPAEDSQTHSFMSTSGFKVGSTE